MTRFVYPLFVASMILGSSLRAASSWSLQSPPAMPFQHAVGFAVKLGGVGK